MGDRGPLAKEQRSRDRDTKAVNVLVDDGVLRGIDLPNDVLDTERGEAWHPEVERFWDAFRRSPQAQLLKTDVSWRALIPGLVIYNDALRGGPRGRAMRTTELRAFYGIFKITPDDLRRAGYEIVQPGDLEETADGDKPKSATVTRLEDRKKRIMSAVPDPKPPAKKAAARKPAAKRAPARKRAPAKKTTTR